jgi:hypothetical protein
MLFGNPAHPAGSLTFSTFHWMLLMPRRHQEGETLGGSEAGMMDFTQEKIGETVHPASESLYTASDTAE